MPGPIAVGLDGSPESLAAASWAAREALRRGVALRLVHAGEGLAATDGESDLPELAVPRRWALRTLREAEEQLTLRYPALRIASEQIPAAPVTALPAAAEEAGLLVLGSRGLGAVAGFLVGSVALATIAHARRPVVLVRSGQRAEDEHLPDAGGNPSTDTAYREVVVGLDPSSSCEALIDFAFDAAARRGAPLRCVHAWSPPASYEDFPAAGYEQGIDAAHEAKARRAVTAVLASWREKFPEQEVSEQVVTGRAAHQLVASASRAGLMVIGRRNRRSALGTHIGPVAHAVIHHALCPVAVVPHD